MANERFDIAIAQQKIADAEKLIEIAKKTRDDAIKAKTESETRLRFCEEELAKLGVTPENAVQELERLESEINSELEAINACIPIELLKTLKRI